MKRLRLILFTFLLSFFTYAGAVVNVTISDGISNDAIKSKMERQMSLLLTEMTSACGQNRDLQYSKLQLSEEVQTAIEMLWENSPFECTDNQIVEHCLTTGTGYQIRNIPLQMKSEDGEEDYQEAVINFDKKGNISSFYISISMNLFMNVVNNNKDVTDLRRRELILDYVEQFRTSYNQKDIKFLNQVFSDDALIITGKVIKAKPRDGIALPDKIEYRKQSKQEYLGKLKQVFAANKQIRVTFDEIEVMRHPTNADIYGVTLHQGYTSDRYHDDGYLFLLWDFKDESAPEIHVRTWQPDMFNGSKLSKDKIFTLSDFDI